ncbi:MAG: carboxymuconolactone decarboxylase family protein [Alphaproteobacteria bacterium]|nr:carboxymuconolactone decarboxylase family protein [Alphaproteobacteria bacterium]
MSIETLKALVPDYAKDIKLNFSSLADDETLTQQQLWGTFLVSALATRQAQVIAEIGAVAAEKLTPEALNAARTAASIMAMNNIYYRFVHLASNEEYSTIPAKLRMNALARPGVDKVDFELWSLAVSAINGCGMCIDSHEAGLKAHNVPAEQIQTAVRVASVVHALAAILDAEQAFPVAAAV